MYIVMGATGNVGGAVAETLLKKGEDVAVVTRERDRADIWRKKGASVLKADVEDIASLKAAFQKGKRAFLLNPPADPSGDNDAVERRTISNILAALDGADLEKVVAASAYGARQGEPAGDLTTLWDLEEGLRKRSIPAAINRGAYYMTNWVGLADTVRESGKLPTMFPSDFAMPMVAPRDLGEAAAERLCSPITDVGIRHVEGPRRYTPRQVADAFARALGRDVELEVAPREAWQEIYKAMGFSAASAKSYTRMTAITLDENFDKPAPLELGKVTLDEFIAHSLRE